METFRAANLELKVRESQGSRMARRAAHTSARENSKDSITRYESRLEVKSATKPRPLSKRQDLPPSSQNRSSSREDKPPTIEDNFEQYSASAMPSVAPNDEVDRGGADRNSIEDSFNQYEHLDKFIENDRR